MFAPHPHLQFVCALSQFSFGPVSLRDPGHVLLQLTFQFLPLVLGLCLRLLQALDLVSQLLIGALLALLSLFQISLKLDIMNSKH